MERLPKEMYSKLELLNTASSNTSQSFILFNPNKYPLRKEMVLLS